MVSPQRVGTLRRGPRLDAGSGTPLRPNLLRVSEQPLTAEFRGHLLVRNNASSGLIGLTLCERPDDIEVILDVFKAAVVRQSVEQRQHCFLGGHGRPRHRRITTTQLQRVWYKKMKLP
jgi:hypothetical protein